MPLQLKKSQSVSTRGLSTRKKNLQRVRIGLAWDKAPKGQPKRDGDISAIPLVGDEVRQVLSTDWVVCFAQKESPDGVIKSVKGDNLDGTGEGDDESIVIDLLSLPAEVVEIALLATIDQAVLRRQDWALLNAVFTIYDDENNDVLAVYTLGQDYKGKTAVQPISLYRNGDYWDIKALGQGSDRSLDDYLKAWGAEVEED